MPAAAVEIRGLTKFFPGFTLGPVDLTVPVGAIYGFVGPNGAGKTTTIDLIFGMGAKEAGTISVLGLDHLRDEVAMKRQVACVSPELNFDAWGRVGRAIDFVRGFYPTWDADYCRQLLEMFELRPGDAIRALSFGSRIKLTLVLALAWRPKLLILDEPTVGLDAIAKRAVFAELLAAVAEGDRTVFISSHAITDLERFADHVGMIRNGRMVLEGPIADVVDRYRIVDLIAPDGARVAEEPGVRVQVRDADRWRALVDRESAAIERLQHRGAQVISQAPVSLEELFVAMGRS